MGEGLEGSSTLDQGIKTFEKDAPFFSLTSIVKSLLEFLIRLHWRIIEPIACLGCLSLAVCWKKCFSLLFNNYACRQHFNGLKYHTWLLFSQHSQLHVYLSNLSLFVAGRCLFHGMMLAWLALMHWSGAQHPTIVKDRMRNEKGSDGGYDFAKLWTLDPKLTQEITQK